MSLISDQRSIKTHDEMRLKSGFLLVIISFISYYPAAEFGFGDTLVAAIRTYLILFIVLCLYFAGFGTWRGQTPGKMVMRIKIVKTDGSSLGIGRAILRSACLIAPVTMIFIAILLVERFMIEEPLNNPILLPVLILVILLFYFPMITLDSKKRALHDKIAGTCVVKT